MANDITNRLSSTSLSTSMVDELLGGIADSRSSTMLAGGKPLLRLLKSGVWVIGQNDDPVQEGSEWAINPLSIRHGHVCWTNYPGNKKNELLGEVMVPITQKKPPIPANIEEWEWKEERIFEAKCVLGDDEGLEVLFKTSSIGGMRAFDVLLGALQAQLKSDPTRPVAVVQLDSQPYDHQKYGQIFNPVFNIVDWFDMSGGGSDPAVEDKREEPAPAPAPEPAPAPRKAAAARPAVARPAAARAPAQETAAAPPPPTRPGAAPVRQRPAARA
jgi:hypothetical protein